MRDSSRMQLKVRSICCKKDGIVSDFEVITSEMKKQFDNCEVVADRGQSICFKARYKDVDYRVVFVPFFSPFYKPVMDVTITKF